MSEESSSAAASVPPSNVPPPIVARSLPDYDEQPGSNSSPLGAALMSRKVERQNQPGLVRPAGRLEQLQIESNADSPRLQGRLDLLRQGEDPSSESSPQGTALMERKLQRQAKKASSSPPEEATGTVDSADEGLLPPPPVVR